MHNGFALGAKPTECALAGTLLVLWRRKNDVANQVLALKPSIYLLWVKQVTWPPSFNRTEMYYSPTGRDSTFKETEIFGKQWNKLPHQSSSYSSWNSGYSLFLKSNPSINQQIYKPLSASILAQTTIYRFLTGLPCKTSKRQRTGTSLVAQWLKICLPMQGTQVRAPVREDPICHGAMKPVHHNCWAHVPQLLKPVHLKPVFCNKRSHRNEKPEHHNEE